MLLYGILYSYFLLRRHWAQDEFLLFFVEPVELISRPIIHYDFHLLFYLLFYPLPLARSLALRAKFVQICVFLQMKLPFFCSKLPSFWFPWQTFGEPCYCAQNITMKWFARKKRQNLHVSKQRGDPHKIFIHLQEVFIGICTQYIISP